MKTTVKTCFKCKQKKAATEFYAHSGMGSGLLGKCKECTKADVRANYRSKRKQYQEYERARANLPHRIKAREDYAKTDAYARSHEKASLKWASNHPDRRKASHIVGNAIRGGKLFRWPVCAIPECDKKPQAHHPDYSRPLDVVWLCPPHHKQAHALVKRAA